MSPKILIVRLGAFGDIVHAVPVLAALRHRWSDARIDWVVDRRYRRVLDLVSGLDDVIEVGATSWPLALPALRRGGYDIAIDLQGLMKSAAIAKGSGARRVLGFHRDHLRERAARIFYTEAVVPPASGHVVEKNMAALAALGIIAGPPQFPLVVPPSPVVDEARAALGLKPGDRFAVINPSAGWPNKQWPPERYGAVAAHLLKRHGLKSAVIWGPGERALAAKVADSSDAAAEVAPSTTLGALAALLRAAAVIISGDTGPLHLATALRTPAIGVFGPTSGARNGPFDPADVSVSRFEQCECHHKRRCRRPTPCIMDISIGEVTGAVDRRLVSVPVHD
jgi:heptosyltransferase-1